MNKTILKTLIKQRKEGKTDEQMIAALLLLTSPGDQPKWVCEYFHIVYDIGHIKWKEAEKVGMTYFNLNTKP